MSYDYYLICHGCKTKLCLQHGVEVNHTLYAAENAITFLARHPGCHIDYWSFDNLLSYETHGAFKYNEIEGYPDNERIKITEPSYDYLEAGTISLFAE